MILKTYKHLNENFLNLNFKNIKIKVIKEIKLLGFVIDDNFNFTLNFTLLIL